MSKNIPAYPSGESYTTFNPASGVTSKHGKSPLHTGMTLRDHFAGLAMQSLYLSAVEWETTGKERDKESLSIIKELACDAYQLADCMIAERNKHHKERHEELLCQGEPL